VVANLLQEGYETLNQISEQRLSEVVQWLKLLVITEDNPEIELEDMWLLATGELKKMDNEAKTDAESIDDWQKYLDEL
jgi:hypothetical protein